MKSFYYCGLPASSREHIPPKLIFKGFQSHKITVPSCREHNIAKSSDDKAIVHAMLISLYNTLKKNPNNQDIIKAIDEAKPYFLEVKNIVKTSRISENLPNELDKQIAYFPSTKTIFAWIRQITAGLVYNVTKKFDSTINWDRASVWSPDWLPHNGPNPIENDIVLKWAEDSKNLKEKYNELTWQPGWWSSGPKSYPTAIYRFQVHIEPNFIVFKHVFFNSYTWYVRFDASQETCKKLISKLKLNNEQKEK